MKKTRITTISHQAIPKEDEGCEWRELKNLKNDFRGHENTKRIYTF